MIMLAQVLAFAGTTAQARLDLPPSPSEVAAEKSRVEAMRDSRAQSLAREIAKQKRTTLTGLQREDEIYYRMTFSDGLVCRPLITTVYDTTKRRVVEAWAMGPNCHYPSERPVKGPFQD